jgi:hypothetical protein
MAMPRTTAESFFRKVDTSGGPDACWPWKGYVARRYGVISIGDRPVRSNRAAWMLTVGDIPAGMVVCHRCDNPLCCNPAHLWLGSVNDNNADCVQKRRHAFGERSAAAILTEQKVRDLLAAFDDGVPRRRIAEMFGVTIHSVYAIASGRNWKHVHREDAA